MKLRVGAAGSRTPRLGVITDGNKGSAAVLRGCYTRNITLAKFLEVQVRGPSNQLHLVVARVDEGELALGTVRILQDVETCLSRSVQGASSADCCLAYMSALLKRQPTQTEESLLCGMFGILRKYKTTWATSHLAQWEQSAGDPTTCSLFVDDKLSSRTE